MNILYITNSPVIGGAELSLLSHLGNLNKEELNATLICSSLLEESAKEIPGIKVIPMEFYILHKANPIVIYRYFKMVRRIISIIKTEKIDIIHTNSVKAHYLGIFASILTRAKLIWWFRDDTINPLIYSLTKHIPSKIIFVSEYLKTLFGNPKNGVVIFNGTERYKHVLSDSKKDALRKHLNPQSQTVILCSERLVKWKGISVLISALDKIRDLDFLCLIVGSGKGQRDDIEFDLIKEVSELHLTEKIKFLGWRNDLTDIYQISDIVVHPVVEPEPFGLVVIEGMSFGIPVISSNIGGPKEVILNDEMGILIPPNDPDILAEKLRDLLSSKYVREKIGEMGRERILNNFTQEIETLSIEKIYISIS